MYNKLQLWRSSWLRVLRFRHSWLPNRPDAWSRHTATPKDCSRCSFRACTLRHCSPWWCRSRWSPRTGGNGPGRRLSNDASSGTTYTKTDGDFYWNYCGLLIFTLNDGSLLLVQLSQSLWSKQVGNAFRYITVQFLTSSLAKLTRWYS